MITAQPDYQQVLESIQEEVRPLLGRGHVADYIPELRKASSERFGMAVYCLDGRTFSTGDADVKFSLQSVTKLFALALAFSREGDNIWKRVGREPSGNPFNSLVQLEHERGIPRNPFINAGALVITDILVSRFVQADVAVLQFMRMLADDPTIDFDMAVAQSEQKTANRNSAIAYFMKNFGNLHNDVSEVIDTYCRQCSITMTCSELAKAGAFLAKHGTVPWTGQEILDPSSAKRLNALMLTCGTYDAAGDFAYRVGLPAKSGVGGGILALLPGEAAIAVWSPGLEANGNSLAGTYALERFTTLTSRSIF
ncbi:glutaminase [Noviherbaspirillum sp. Root189]|uniref:glutaminase n=1 Tax=Noviherbaspirillum sp. Root189 TaxID=1736487 RepID=UPI00070DE207|nr:glutaminase [Noviherbaspirillum sp. Root189]KRB88952.1 glutaminase A [Noviherbaspirillum sp. Root189]